MKIIKDDDIINCDYFCLECDAPADFLVQINPEGEYDSRDFCMRKKCLKNALKLIEKFEEKNKSK